MTKEISSSPDRHTFQHEAYIKRCEETNVEPSDGYENLFESIRTQHKTRWDNPEYKINNLEYDLLTTDWMLEKVRGSESYAQNLYAAMCNRDFVKLDLIPILTEERWSRSWRSAGGIIADMRGKGDYIDWYCSGIGNDEMGFGLLGKRGNGYVSESVVTAEVEADLKTLGWIIIDDTND